MHKGLSNMERLKKKQLALQYKSEQKNTKLGRIWLTKLVLVKLSLRDIHTNVYPPFHFLVVLLAILKTSKLQYLN